MNLVLTILSMIAPNYYEMRCKAAEEVAAVIEEYGPADDVAREDLEERLRPMSKTIR